MGFGILAYGGNTAHFSPRFPSRTTCPCKTACLSSTWSAMVFSFPSVYRGRALTEPVCQWRRGTGAHRLAVKCWSVILTPNKVGTGDWRLKQIAPGLRESGGVFVCRWGFPNSNWLSSFRVKDGAVHGCRERPAAATHVVSSCERWHTMESVNGAAFPPGQQLFLRTRKWFCVWVPTQAQTPRK